MSKSSSEKPPKPYPGFPLFPHATRRWAKKIRGKLRYFGPWTLEDPGWQAALDKYNQQAAALHAGREPKEPNAPGLRIKDLLNHFRTTQLDKLQHGAIVRTTYKDYVETCDRIINHFGREEIVEHLTIEDFHQFKRSMAKTLGVRTLGNEINRVRIVFRYAYEQGLIDRPVRFGREFSRPSKVALRRHRQAQGKKLFTAEQIRRLIEKASPPLKAMILLGINCGFGNNDCASLTWAHLDLERGWHDFPRPKTGIERHAPLWPETVAAIAAYRSRRPEPRDAADAEIVFVTKYGRRFVRDADNAVTKEFRKLLDEVGLKGGFYWLRHTFETIAGESADQVAVDHIMGHAKETMATEYREMIGRERLEKVSQVVFKWLFPPEMERHSA